MQERAAALPGRPLGTTRGGAGEPVLLQPLQGLRGGWVWGFNPAFQGIFGVHPPQTLKTQSGKCCDSGVVARAHILFLHLCHGVL